MSDALPNGILKINGDRINPATDEVSQALAGFVLSTFDYVGVTYPNSTTEIYVYRSGGASGSIVATVTATYSDSTKISLTSLAKT